MGGEGYLWESLFRKDKIDVNITQTNFMRFIFSIKSICYSICRLLSNTAFPNTSNGLIFLRHSEAVVPRCPDVLQNKCS